MDVLRAVVVGVMCAGMLLNPERCGPLSGVAKVLDA
jgi:hypothetical protein